MNNQYLVSIIVPVYNASKTLDRCVKSLIDQTYKNIEIILIDDGSQDNSGSLCDEYKLKDKRIKVIHKSNGGVSSARNKGFKESTGDFILCVDSDDYVNDNYVEIFMKAIEEFPEYGHYWCGIRMIEENEKSTYFIMDQTHKYSFFDKKQIQYLSTQLYGLYPYAKLYDRNYILEHDMNMDENITLGEDALFNYQYLDEKENDSILFINETPYFYMRSQNDSLDTKYYSNLYDIYKYNNAKYNEYLQKWNVNQEQFNLLNNSKFYNYERIFKNTFRKENKKSFFNKLKYNSQIMKSKDFKQSLTNFTNYIHPLYKKAYQRKSYFWVMLVDVLVKIRHMV